jgi:deoxyribodipyrimidine photo-lyase
LITPEDLTPEDTIGPWEIRGVVSVLEPGAGRLGEHPQVFMAGALADAERRAAVRYGRPALRLADLTGDGLVGAARAAGAQGIVTPFVPVGATASALARAYPALTAAGLDLVMVRRPWDEALWPLASRGFFPFRERSEGVLRTLGLPV